MLSSIVNFYSVSNTIKNSSRFFFSKTINKPLRKQEKEKKCEDRIIITHSKDLDLKDAVSSSLYQDWLNSILETNFKLHSLHFQSLDMFGSRAGFVKFKSKITLNGDSVPGIVFARGGSVAVLIKLISNETKEEYSVLTTQPRVPIGKESFPEIPAGMLDGESENFVGVAAKELEEETGITITKSQLIDLSGKAYSGKNSNGAIYPSPGGCDEFIKIYYYERSLPNETILKMNKKITGNKLEREKITLKLIKFKDLWKETSDAKSLCAFLLYEKLLQDISRK
ncbi:nudix hydrolase 14 [Anaeramoeba flamelloides]|uniref:Nudix hydrolase 14 n=1 Tax=Anaeramoeba flamelloides TaxID=1746091 RepID=A0AAV7Z1F9_9EUKA|nr:nudix hydrolase 14 [Anaeramoeba flamelloides]KAJ6227398.1 nudix hydrolase 14 [Anaeramoeba flamelloides]